MYKITRRAGTSTGAEVTLRLHVRQDRLLARASLVSSLSVSTTLPTVSPPPRRLFVGCNQTLYPPRTHIHSGVSTRQVTSHSARKMHPEQGHYGPRPNYHPQRNKLPTSPPRQMPANSLLERISDPAAESPTRTPGPYNASLHPRAPETQALAPVFATGKHPEPVQASLPSEETVDAFLESVLKTEVASLRAPSAPASAPSGTAAPGVSLQPEAATKPPSPVYRGRSDPALLSSTRALLLPQLLANARARGPGEKWDEAEATNRAQALITDEWCEEMIALARRTREEMRRRVAETEAARGTCAEVAGGSGKVNGTRAESVSVSEDVATSLMDTREDEVERTSTIGPNAREDEDMRMEVVEQPEPPEDQDTEDMGMYVTEDIDPSPPQIARAQEHGMQLEQPLETMLGNAARVLQDFLGKTPRQRNGTLPEVAVTLRAEKSAPPAGPSTIESPHSVNEIQTGEVAHVPTTLSAGSGLWAVQIGSNVPRITTVTFDVQESVAAAVQRWARRHSAFE